MSSIGSLGALLLLVATPALANTVVSAKPEAVAVVIYRDGPARAFDFARPGGEDTRGLALIVETRSVDLPAGRSRIRFEGVADGIIPQSAAVQGLPGRIAERNFDYDLLSPGSLLAHSIGQTVRLVRTDAKTGREHQEAATLVSGPDGVMLKVGGHIEALNCGGETERLVFDHAPSGLSDKPTLSVLADAPRAGRFQVRVSYLTVRLNWAADYVARINPDGRTLALTGWLTLANRGATGFADAPTEVVAGHLARQPVDLPSIAAKPVQPECWPDETTHGGWPAPPSPMLLEPRVPGVRMASPMVMRTMMVTAEKRVSQSQLGDYKLYTLAEPTTVAARQTKQVMFLDQPAVRFETVYTHAVSGYGSASGPPEAAAVVLRLENKSDHGLGQPLPAGNISLRLRHAGRELFAGEHPLARDVPVDEPFEIDGGAASDVSITERKTSDTGHSAAFELFATNAKRTAVTVEIRHQRGYRAGFEVAAESAPHGLTAGDPVWRLAIPAGESRQLTYTVSYTQP